MKRRAPTACWDDVVKRWVPIASWRCWGDVVKRGALDTSESAVPGGDVVERKAPVDGVLGRRC